MKHLTCHSHRALVYLFALFLTPIFAFADPPTTQPLIRVDQFGYLPDMQKIAVISNPQVGYNSADSFTPSATLEVRRWADDVSVFSGPITTWSGGTTHVPSGDQAWWFDFSSVTAPDDYYIYDPSQLVGSYRFRIAEDVFKPVLIQAMRTFFYQRSGFAKQTPFADANWADAASHLNAEQDLDCRLVTDPTNVATSQDLSGGWYDAGDFNKYVNFTYSVMHDLLDAYQQNSVIWTDDFNLPESNNGIPDLLDEVKWELDWLLKMQQADGACLMKVSVIDFAASSPPSTDLAHRRYGPAEASATRTICSIFAHAATVYRSLGIASMNTFADTLEARSLKAWNWIVANPTTSNYGNNGFQSANPERSAYEQEAIRIGAAAYLFELTGDTQYQSYFDTNYNQVHALQWTYWYPFESNYQNVLLYYCDLPGATASVVSAIQSNCINSVNNNNAELMPAFTSQSDPYRAHLANNDYTWGSNSNKARMGILYSNMLHHNLSTANHTDYRNAAAGYIHYMHGVNPNGLTYLTNMGAYGAEASANEMYHAWFGHGTDYDNAQTSLYGPAPGYVPGGPNPNFAPASGYYSPPQGQPIQKSYLDWNTSWPQNSWEVTEPAIYYQAAYVKLLAQFTSNGSSALAVDLDYFQAKPLEQSVMLDWRTVNELDSDHFVVERSLDGLVFEALGRVNANGASQSSQGYQYEDLAPPNGKLWYRLKEVDLLGKQTYSDKMEVYFRLLPDFQLLPNPAKEEVQLAFYYPGITAYEIRIYSLQGQLVQQETVRADAADFRERKVGIASLPSGMYLLAVVADGERWVKRLVKE